jgi:HlyD family secretion protein
MLLDGSVNQVDAERLRLGMNATIKLDAYPEWKTGGTLIAVGALAKPSTFRRGYFGEVPVRLRIDGQHSLLLPDLTGSADLVIHGENNVLLAPRPAVFKENGQSFVFVRQANGWMRRTIVTGSSSATHVAVRAGLQSGENVALQPPL